MRRSYNRPVLLSLLPGIAVIVIFVRSLGNRFIDWDDRNEIFGNSHFNPVTIANLNWNWTHTQLTLYMPVTYMVWGAVAAIAPRDPAGVLQPAVFHLLNLLLHLICSILVFVLLRQLWRRDAAALVGALVFAVHPLQVEAVSWASGMYTLLSAALSLGALILYTAGKLNRDGSYLFPAVPRPARINWDGSYLLSVWFLVATLLYVLALLTKAASVSLPLVAGVIDYFVLQRRGRSVSSAVDPAVLNATASGSVDRPSVMVTVRSLWVWGLLGVPIVLLAKSFQDMTNVPTPPVWGRPVVALDAIGFYLTKLVLPRGLIPDYGRNPTWVMNHLPIVAGSVGIATIALFIALVARHRAGWITAGLGVFVAGVSPYLGLMTFDFQYVSTVADRYAYFGMVGIAMLACGAAVRERGAMVGLLVAVVAWSVISFGQVRWWYDTDTLFAHTLGVNPNSLVAHNVLGYEAAHTGRPVEAERWYHGALAIWPADATIWFNLGNLHLKNDPAAAIAEYRQAIHYLPNKPDFHKNLAAAFVRAGDPARAVDQYLAAIALDPTDPDTHYGLACLFESANDDRDAMKEYQAVLRLSPSHTGAAASVNRLTR